MFGGQQSRAATSFGFGTATTSQAGGGLFGAASAQKPALSFGTTTTQATPAFGATTNTFGAGGGLFGGAASTAAKPGGLFGGTGTFGTAGSAFGATGSTFGAGGSLGSTAFPAAGGGMFSGGTLGATQPQLQAPQPAANNPIQQQLVQLATSPYGDNPLFKNLADPGRREDILKPVNPAAQKALDSTTQYKVSPHRSVKPRAKPINSLGSKSAIFEGLEDDDVNTKSSDLFVPRSSVKKLVLKLSLKSPDVSSPAEGARADPTSPQHQQSLNLSQHNRSAEESLNLPAVRDLGGAKGGGGNISIVDESFAALNPQKAKKKDEGSSPTGDVASPSAATPAATGGGPSSADASVADGSEELELDDGIGPADVILR